MYSSVFSFLFIHLSCITLPFWSYLSHVSVCKTSFNNKLNHNAINSGRQVEIKYLAWLSWQLFPWTVKFFFYVSASILQKLVLMDAAIFAGGFRVGDGKNWGNETLNTLVVSSKHVNYMFHDKKFLSNFLYSQVRNKSETYKWG